MGRTPPPVTDAIRPRCRATPDQLRTSLNAAANCGSGVPEGRRLIAGLQAPSGD